jgi:hypothetical protein
MTPETGPRELDGLLTAFQRRRETLRWMLVEAQVRPQDAERVLVDALARVRAETWKTTRDPEALLLKVVREACEEHASLRQGKKVRLRRPP